MKVLKRKMLNVLLAFVMIFSFAFLGWGGIFTAMSAKAETTTVNLTFNELGLNGGENNDNTFGGTNYYTCIRFTTGVFSGEPNGASDFSDLTEKASYVGSGNTDGQWGFAPGYSKWPAGYKNDAVFNFIYLWTANKPAADDTIAMKAGSYFTMSGTMADGTGACDDKYVLAEDINLKFNGTAWEYYVPVVEPEYAIVNLTFGSLGLNGGENNDGTIVSGRYLTAVRFTTGVLSGSTDTETAAYDYSNLIENTIYNGDNEWGFAPAATKWATGYKNDAVFNFLYFYTANQPTQGDMVTMKAGAYFTMSGTTTEATACNDKYILTQDVVFTFNGTVWTVPVTTTYSVYESTDPEVIHTYSTYQNTDGSFTYTLPEYEREGKVLLGYVMNYMENEAVAQTFIPSGEYTTDATVLAFIALWGEFKTVDGASIRISSAETSGIRWTTNIDEEGFNNIAYWAKNGFTFGTELSADGFDENFDIVANVWKVENSQYTGVLTDINSKYYTQEFTARGYVDITYHNGVTKRIYAIANDTTRSIKEVAEKAIASGDYSGTQLTILQQIAGV